ncbi:MAG: hypothetical protein HC915_11200 [Anaerolineae bacterium]|nr:hypothetical protein [Anaerolineae bacterium]
MTTPEFLQYYIRVTNVRLFDLLVEAAEKTGVRDLEASREQGYYILRTNNQFLWKDIFLYGQMLAQAQDDFIEAGEH